MKIFYAVCFLLGSLVVFQPSLNRLIFAQKGLSYAVLINGAILFCLTTLLFLSISYAPERFPELLRFLPGRAFQWWYVLPGIMGFLLVLVVPLMIKSIGAFPTVVMMIIGQIATSFLWDIYQEGALLSGSRLLGLVFVMTGAYFSFKPTM